MNKKIIAATLATTFLLSACIDNKNDTSNKTPTTASGVKTTTAAASSVDNSKQNSAPQQTPEAVFNVLLGQAGLKVVNIQDSELVGFKEVNAVGINNDDAKMKIVISSDFKYMFNDNAQIIDIATNQVAEKFAASQDTYINKKYLTEGFDKTKTFTWKKGNGERKIAVFTDPDCPFCKRFEQTLKDVDNIEVVYIPLPIKSLHPNAENVTNKIWSVSPEKRLETWHKYVETGELPENNSETPYDLNYSMSLSQEFGINGTPAIINMKNGKLIMGALPKEHLEEFLK